MIFANINFIAFKTGATTGNNPSYAILGDINTFNNIIENVFIWGYTFGYEGFKIGIKFNYNSWQQSLRDVIIQNCVSDGFYAETEFNNVL